MRLWENCMDNLQRGYVDRKLDDGEHIIFHLFIWGIGSYLTCMLKCDTNVDVDII